METSEETAVKRLIETNVKFKKAYHDHKDCDRMVDKLERKFRLTAEEETEKVRLKKLKLSLKDEIERMLAQHKQAC